MPQCITIIVLSDGTNTVVKPISIIVIGRIFGEQYIVMKSLTRIMFMTLVIMIAGTAIFLSTWNIPAPVATIEKVIPNDRFSK